MSYHKIKSYAKINLALNVIGKKKSLHKIETIVSFLELHDEIFIKKIDQKNHKIKFIGEFSKKIGLNNTIFSLLKNIEKKKLLKSKFQIIVNKKIPSKAGLGGGSMNASNILRFLIKKKFIKVEKDRLIKITNPVGSDVLLGVYSKNLILQPNGKIKTFKAKKKIYTLIVKPNFGCSTKKIYSEVKKYSKPEFNNISKDMFKFKHLKKLKNDLEPVALSNYPKLKILKKFLEKLSNHEFVRMTGSGSAIIVYFNTVGKCKDAEKKVKKQFRNYWCKISKTI